MKEEAIVAITTGSEVDKSCGHQTGVTDTRATFS